MKKVIIALASCSILAACEQTVPCMAPSEQGTVKTIQSVRYYDNAFGRFSDNPTLNTLIVSFTMEDKSERVCKGRWYEESSLFKVGQSYNVTKLERTNL